MTAPRTRRLAGRALPFACFLGLPSLVAPLLVYVDWTVLRPLYAWTLVEHIENAGSMVELTTIAAEIALVVALAGAIGAMGMWRPLRARPVAGRWCLFGLVGLLIASYGALLVSADLATFVIVSLDGTGLGFGRRALWLSGPTMRAVSVVASLASAILITWDGAGSESGPPRKRHEDCMG